MPGSRSLAAAGLWVVLAWPLAAGASDPPLFVFFGQQEPGIEEARARADLEALADRLGTALIDLSPGREPAPEAPGHLERAIDAYLKFDYRGALEHAAAGVAEATATGGRGLTPAALSDLFLYRGLALAELGDERGAWDELVRAATVDPTRRLDPVRFPPSAAAAFERAAGAVRAGDRAELVVAVEERCRVEVDGRSVRPREPVELAAGEHMVRVECPGLLAHGASLVVTPPRLEIAPRLRAPEPATAARAAALARARGAARALVARVTAGDGGQATLTLAIVDARGRTRGRLLVRLDRGAGATAAAERLLAPAAAAAGPAVDPTPARGGRSRARFFRGAGWALAGAAGAAAVAALVAPRVLDRESGGGFGVRIGGQVP